MAKRRKTKSRRRINKNAPVSKKKVSEHFILQSQNKRKKEYAIKWERKHRNLWVMKKLLDNINYKKIVKAFPKTRFVNVTFFGEYRKKIVARTYIAQTEIFNEDSIKSFFKEFASEIYSGHLDYGIKKTVKWKNYLIGIKMEFE